jgi:hypothetical protein
VAKLKRSSKFNAIPYYPGRSLDDYHPNNLFSRLNLIATYVMSGNEETAHAEAVEVLRQSPNFSVERLLMNFPYKDPKIVEGLRECWIKAGLK